MTKNLLIVFVKNIQLGKVKTRLAKTIGNQKAFEIYKELVELTENITRQISNDKRVYFSESVDHHHWGNSFKAVQNGVSLGERMQNAFEDGFKAGYENIILIGSDLPDISTEIIYKGFNSLKDNDVVFGPAEDGGYYLIGLSKMLDTVFENKPWSQSNLLEVTLQELSESNQNVSLLAPLNDIDTIDDLIQSTFYKHNNHIQELVNTK